MESERASLPRCGGLKRLRRPGQGFSKLIRQTLVRHFQGRASTGSGDPRGFGTCKYWPGACRHLSWTRETRAPSVLSDFGAQGVPRLGLRWPKMIDTLLRRKKICWHSSNLSTMDAQAERIAGNTWARKAVKKEYRERTNNIIGGSCRTRAGINGIRCQL